ncbi:hypothetical protein [Sandaracinobacteroides hominis]|uniref:hypothetical protein n=1 Tax=Sandaracinobacteroides hominis TaxID=2780086 RepID=UPI0018F622B2|nr:hypothetical protein [Sandaracinobacteroides hominis]
MDLNQLYFDHQLLLMQARGAASEDTRLRLGYNASVVAGSIERLNSVSGAPRLRHWKGGSSGRSGQLQLKPSAK